jgi:hypothetical protein
VTDGRPKPEQAERAKAKSVEVRKRQLMPLLVSRESPSVERILASHAPHHARARCITSFDPGSRCGREELAKPSRTTARKCARILRVPPKRRARPLEPPRHRGSGTKHPTQSPQTPATGLIAAAPIDMMSCPAARPTSFSATRELTSNNVPRASGRNPRADTTRASPPVMPQSIASCSHESRMRRPVATRTCTPHVSGSCSWNHTPTPKRPAVPRTAESATNDSAAIGGPKASPRGDPQPDAARDSAPHATPAPTLAHTPEDANPPARPGRFRRDRRPKGITPWRPATAPPARARVRAEQPNARTR